MGDMADMQRDWEMCNWPEDDWMHDQAFDPQFHLYDDYETWGTKDGRTLSIEDMTDAHVQHTFVFLKRNHPTAAWMIARFAQELKRRGLTVLHVHDDWVGKGTK